MGMNSWQLSYNIHKRIRHEKREKTPQCWQLLLFTINTVQQQQSKWQNPIVLCRVRWDDSQYGFTETTPCQSYINRNTSSHDSTFDSLLQFEASFDILTQPIQPSNLIRFQYHCNGECIDKINKKRIHFITSMLLWWRKKT